MGDLVELTTIPKEQKMFFKIPTGALKFAVKGSSNAGIGILSSLDLKNIDYWVVLGHRHYTWIKSRSVSKIANTPNILSPDEYRSFWISWLGPSMNLGRDGETEPILTFPARYARELSYVTFFVKNGGTQPVLWRFELPPEIPRPVEKHIDGGKVQWVRSGNQVPWNAVIGGYENETLYIIRALHNHSLAVGKFVPSKGVGYIAWGSLTHEKRDDDLEFLVGYDCQWVQSSGGQIPVGAIVGGYTEHHLREKIFVARARCMGHLIPGKLHRMYKQCYTPHEGREVSHSTYEVLVSTDINRRSIKRKFSDNNDVETPDQSAAEGSDDEEGNQYEVYEEDFEDDEQHYIF